MVKMFQNGRFLNDTYSYYIGKNRAMHKTIMSCCGITNLHLIDNVDRFKYLSKSKELVVVYLEHRSSLRYLIDTVLTMDISKVVLLYNGSIDFEEYLKSYSYDLRNNNLIIHGDTHDLEIYPARVLLLNSSGVVEHTGYQYESIKDIQSAYGINENYYLIVRNLLQLHSFLKSNNEILKGNIYIYPLLLKSADPTATSDDYRLKEESITSITDLPKLIDILGEFSNLVFKVSTIPYCLKNLPDNVHLTPVLPETRIIDNYDYTDYGYVIVRNRASETEYLWTDKCSTCNHIKCCGVRRDYIPTKGSFKIDEVLDI